MNFAENRSSIVGGVVLIVLGGMFLLNNFGVLPGGLFALWPLAVLAGGGWQVWQALTRKRGRGLTVGVFFVALGGFWLAENFRLVDNRLFGPVVLIALGAGQLAGYFYKPPVEEEKDED